MQEVSQDKVKEKFACCDCSASKAEHRMTQEQAEILMQGGSSVRIVHSCTCLLAAYQVSTVPVHCMHVV